MGNLKVEVYCELTTNAEKHRKQFLDASLKKYIEFKLKDFRDDIKNLNKDNILHKSALSS